MDLDAVCIVIVNDVGNGVELMVYGHHLARSGDAFHEQRFAFANLVGVLPVFFEPQHHGAGGFFWNGLRISVHPEIV